MTICSKEIRIISDCCICEKISTIFRKGRRGKELCSVISLNRLSLLKLPADVKGRLNLDYCEDSIRSKPRLSKQAKMF